MNRMFLLITSLLILVVFTFTSCFGPLSYLPQEPGEYVIEIGKGTPVFIYLDSDYKPITEPVGINDPDPGKTALVVLDNPMAEGVMVLAETTAEGTTVSIISKNDQSAISMFFDEGKNFPSSLIIKSPGERINAFFSSYNTQKEHYSIAFEGDDDEGNMILHDVIMSQSILNVYTDDSTLCEAQNARIRNIYTSLGVFASLNYELSGDGFNSTIFLAWGWKEILTVALVVVAVVALVVAVVLAPPAAIAVVGATIVIAGAGTASTIAAGVAAAAIVGAIIIGSTDLIKDEGGSAPPQAPQSGRLHVTIWKKTKDKETNEVKKELIGPETVSYVAPDSEVEFEIRFLNRVPEIEDIAYFFYDPKTRSTGTLSNSVAFSSVELNGEKKAGRDIGFPGGPIPKNDINGDDIHTLKIFRDDFPGEGYAEGALWFGLNFMKQEANVNSKNVPFVPLSNFVDNAEGSSRIYFIKMTMLSDYGVP